MSSMDPPEPEPEPEPEQGMDMAECSGGKDGEMIESYDRRELLIAHDGCADAGDEPCVGMEFASEDDARAFYDAYAGRVGFRVRISRCHRSLRNGSIVCRRLVCSREGFHVPQNPGGSKRPRMITRVGCLAMLSVKMQSSGRWIVDKFVREHNHELADPVEGALKAEKNADLDPDASAAVEGDPPLPPPPPPPGRSDLEPFEGMEFPSEEAARVFYYAYAKEMRFTVRISKCRRVRDGSISCRQFVCSKEGFYVRKFARTKRSRALTRVGCLARLVVKKLDSGAWVVAHFEKEHNHPPFVTGTELSYQPSNPTRRIHRVAHASPSAPIASAPNGAEVGLQSCQDSVAWRFNRLHQEGIRFAEQGATSVQLFNVAMFALREATQKVIAAKNSAAMVSQLGNVVRGGDNNLVHGENDSVNQETLSGGQHCSIEGNEASSHNGSGVMRLVLIAPGLPNESGQSPLVANVQAVQVGPSNRQQNTAVAASDLKRLSPDAHSLDANGSLCSDMSAGMKREHMMVEEDGNNLISSARDIGRADSKQDEAATQSQGWRIVGMGQVNSQCEGGDNSTSMALSEAQVAALQAVAAAFNVPTMGATSSSAVPIKVLPVSDELADDNKGYLLPHGSSDQSMEFPHQYSGNPGTPSANPLVHAAAVAAGARIASPAVAASLIKAVQSRTAVHVRSGGLVPKLQVGFGGEPLASPEGHLTNPNIHYFQTEEQSTPLSSIAGGVPGFELPGTHQVSMAGEVGGIQTGLVEHADLLDASFGQEETIMYHDIIEES